MRESAPYLGKEYAKWLFAGAGLFGLIISFAMAPETKGRSLEDITNAIPVDGVVERLTPIEP